MAGDKRDREREPNVSDDDERSPETTKDPSDAEIEREIRSRRRFSLAEAIGRSAGDLLHGASPVTRRRQAEFVIEEFLEQNLSDGEGALGPVLLRRISHGEELLSNYDDPLRALADVLGRLLGSDEALDGFVASVDTEWGRMYQERPRFESGDGPPAGDDPYTVESVRSTLRSLLVRLQTDDASSDSDKAGP